MAMLKIGFGSVGTGANHTMVVENHNILKIILVKGMCFFLPV